MGNVTKGYETICFGSASLLGTIGLVETCKEGTTGQALGLAPCLKQDRDYPFHIFQLQGSHGLIPDLEPRAIDTSITKR